MAAFFRGLLLFLFGVLAGAAGILFLTPSFQVDVRRGNTAIKPVDFGASVASPSPTPAPVSAVPATPSPVASTPASAPAKTAAATGSPVIPAVSPVAAEASLDFAAISRHLILWPTAVTVKTPATVIVTVEGQKPRDLALEAGAVLQLTRVLPTGQLEVRAKGEKFEIKSTFTDFAAELGKRVTELVAKGTKFDSPYPTTASPAVSAPAVVMAPVVAAPKKPLTLAERIDVLYGHKPAEPEAPVVPSVPAAPAASAAALVTPAPMPAPATPVVASATPAPAASPASEPTTREAAKVEEKGKDLDRKMNQLFK